ncbi:NAD(P)-dependent dehydrogenase (short-subunit alcohol dehydrogenase family) [Erythromicrobium ramosum]|uniref:NAD(P)-dependent dehydrogenase (Short-subunit alcohol dehydrogenase family) n=2 Tax=Erythrobacter ramosus TaxID=35811 RepID=A0ABR6I208_9SPHN|nr:NAD(P)-dependent dehydrogenase (short-subunit alcohol dehydrogenase family) [Erythrobacter ramosus]
MALMGWLDKRTVRLVGASQVIAAAIDAQGGRVVTDGACDALVHFVAAPIPEPAHEISHANWRQTLDAGLDQRFLLAREFAAARRSAGAGGAIVFVGAPEQDCGSDHAAASGALGNLTKTLGVEWARDGIRVNTVLTSAACPTLGNIVAYLLSDFAAYVTGAVTGVGLDD